VKSGAKKSCVILPFLSSILEHFVLRDTTKTMEEPTFKCEDNAFLGLNVAKSWSC